MNNIEKDRRLNPPTFNGGSDPLVTETKKLFDVIVVNAERKAQLATFMLRGSTERWWNMKKDALIPPITWEVLLEAFNAEYFSYFLIQRKETEFAKLQQDKLSVAEYVDKYIDLRRFRLKVMMNELKKARRFKKGLRPEL